MKDRKAVFCVENVNFMIPPETVKALAIKYAELQTYKETLHLAKAFADHAQNNAFLDVMGLTEYLDATSTPLAHTEVKAVMKKVPCAHNNKLSFEEFVQFLALRAGKETELRRVLADNLQEFEKQVTSEHAREKEKLAHTEGVRGKAALFENLQQQDGQKEAEKQTFLRLKNNESKRKQMVRAEIAAMEKAEKEQAEAAHKKRARFKHRGDSY